MCKCNISTFLVDHLKTHGQILKHMRSALITEEEEEEHIRYALFRVKIRNDGPGATFYTKWPLVHLIYNGTRGHFQLIDVTLHLFVKDKQKLFEREREREKKPDA